MSRHLDKLLRKSNCGYDRNDNNDQIYTDGRTRGPDNNLQNIFSRFGRFGRTYTLLEARRPEHIDVADWQQAVEDGRRFLAQWGEQAEALGWTSRDLFGLAPVPDKPAPNYRRLSRYDLTGLIWLLRGRPVAALTADTAAIQNSTGAITVYRKHYKPALGPVGDSLDDLDQWGQR
jgi:hypothetical protein